MHNPKSPFAVSDFILNELRKGKSKAFLEKELALSKYYLNKHLWLKTWPQELIDKCLLFSEIFTPRLLFSTFASRQKYYSKNDFQYLRAEIDKLIQNGAMHKPRKAVNYPKMRAGGSLITQRVRQKNLKEIVAQNNHEIKNNQILNLDFQELLYYQQLFKEALGFHVIVQYSKSKEEGEVRINFKREKDLEYLLEKMQ
jgi:hypothetical protein